MAAGKYVVVVNEKVVSGPLTLMQARIKASKIAGAKCKKLTR